MGSEASAEPAKPRRLVQLLRRIGLVQAVLLVAIVLAALPIAFQSMGVQLTGRQARTLYDFPTGQEATAEATAALADAESFFNIGVIDLDEDTSSVTLSISGHRQCDGDCPPMTITLFSLEDDADVRRALPPSATLTMDPTQQFFSLTAQLPIRGQPSQFPFDDYLLWLGMSGAITIDGKRETLIPATIAGRAIFTIQNQLRDFTMRTPTEIDPARVRSITDPFDFFGVQELRFERPIHQEILAVLLVTLIAVSAVMAVSMRDVSDLIVGIGSLVLGIWGVRSVLVPSGMTVATSVDLALSVVILIVLLGLCVRGAQYLHRESDLPPITLPRRKASGGRRRDNG